jgi:hypothetical protein
MNIFVRLSNVDSGQINDLDKQRHGETMEGE